MPRFSIPLKDEQGRVIGIACGSRRRRVCSSCKGAGDAKFECDGCDKPLCASCAVSPKKGLDLCPKCFEPAWKHWLTFGPRYSVRAERREAFRSWARENPKTFLELVPLGKTAQGTQR